MKRTLVFGLLIFSLLVGICSAFDGNIGLLEYGGKAEQSGTTLPSKDDLANLFDGSNSSYCRFDSRRFLANGLNIDRIWEGTVEIEAVEFAFRYANGVPDFKLLYWDLDKEDWVVAHEVKDYKGDDHDPNPRYSYEFDQPIKTNKIRFNILKVHDRPIQTVRELSYYGRILDK